MSKFHVNNAGDLKVCKATVAECPLGGEHFNSESEYENHQTEVFTKSLNIPKEITGDDSDYSPYDLDSENFYKTLDIETSELIESYVNQEYQTINETLWDNQKYPGLDKMNQVLSKKSEYKTLWRKPPRSSNINWGSLKLDETIELKGFTSTSVNPNAMIPLMQEHIDRYMSEVPFEDWEYENGDENRRVSPPKNFLDQDPNTVFQIITDKGQPVSAKSHMTQEKEILLPSATKWKVVGIKKKIKFYSKKNLLHNYPQQKEEKFATVIQLVEVA